MRLESTQLSTRMNLALERKSVAAEGVVGSCDADQDPA